MLKWLLPALVIIVSCANDNKPIEPLTIEKAGEKAKLYCELSKAGYDAKKWVVDMCDGAGFTALYAVACQDNKVDLDTFQMETGEMRRGPKRNECYKIHSDSSFSKDHVLMSLIAWHELKRHDLAKKFYDYVLENNLTFCEGKDTLTTVSRCIISPFLLDLLRHVANAGGSSDAAPEESSDATGLVIRKGFEAHLDVLGIWLKGRIKGGITDNDIKRLEKYVEREKENALYVSVAYRYGVVDEETALKTFFTKYFPEDRLPDRRDYCTEYLFQRDFTLAKDWIPCSDSSRKDAHSGTDYGFAYYVLSK